jgi:asparagine synthase (glutamine-hydrolysing)
MCGFAGVLDRSGASREQLQSTVATMAEAVRMRGPDDSGEWADGCGIAFGFRRLSIIDLSAAGHQPMVSPDGRLVLVMNGEIYNHGELRAMLDRTRTTPWIGHSDTETLLAGFGEWGVRATLDRAVGMFALALWDRADRRLYLARDRFGEKPLYYGWAGKAFVFGSELKSLRRCPGFDNEIDRDALALFLRYTCVPAPYSIYKRVYKLQPACVLTLDANSCTPVPSSAPFAPWSDRGLTIERYWSLADVVARTDGRPLEDVQEAKAQLETALTDAVRLQSIADVPLGAFLSGGIDSSLIVALMQRQSGRNVRTFTIGFDQGEFNEAEHAKAVAAHLGTDHAELYVTDTEARDVIPRLPDIYSEPFADSSQIPTYLVSRMARQHVTVALTGDGGDELFGGYVRHQWAPRIWRRLQWTTPGMRRHLASVLESVPAGVVDSAGRLLGTPWSRPSDKLQKVAQRIRSVDSLADLYRMLVTTWPPQDAIVCGATAAPTLIDVARYDLERRDSSDFMMFWDALTYLPDDILHKVDRASMSVSLETRAPFLDHRVADLAWRLPASMKIAGGQSKWLLRQLLYQYVPSKLMDRPKMGFGVPLDQWLRGPLRDWVEDLLDEHAMRSQGYFDPTPIRRKWTENLRGDRSWPYELWCILMFQAWLQVHTQ